MFDHNKWNATQNLTVVAKADSLYNTENRIVFLRLRTDQFLFHEAWSHSIIPDIKVGITYSGAG